MHIAKKHISMDIFSIVLNNVYTCSVMHALLSLFWDVQTKTVATQSEKMIELENNLAQAHDFLDKVEAAKESALSAAEQSREFVRRHPLNSSTFFPL